MMLKPKFMGINEFIAIHAVCFLFPLLLLMCVEEQVLFRIYGSIQNSLFTGFLTVGGFILSLKTFILIKMRDDLYDSEEYVNRFKRKLSINSDLKLYAPLRRLGGFLVYCVIWAISTAIMQITFGFLPYKFAKALPLSASILTLFLVIIAWWQIKLILNDWFDILDQRKFEPTPIPDEERGDSTFIGNKQKS